MADHLQRKIVTLRTRQRLKNQQIALQKAEIATLRASLSAFVNENRGHAFNGDIADEDVDEDANSEFDSDLADIEQYTSNNEAADDEASVGQDLSDDEEKIPNAVWDKDDQIFRCCKCVWEVVDGMCQACGTEHDYITDDAMHIPPSISIDNESLSSDRSLVSRGSTPLLEVGNEPIPVEYQSTWSSGWTRDRSGEYRALLSRGATRLMCETFHLELTTQNSIFAWADSEIFDTFSGPAMKQGDFWKIHLGRCLELDGDDLDGSQFIEGLLEDALIFPLVPLGHALARWETVEETPGVWVTRPTKRGRDINNISAATGKALLSSGESECSDGDAESLECPPHVRGLPVILPDEYELSDVESVTASDDVVEMADPGYTWQAGVPDGGYPSSEEEEPSEIIVGVQDVQDVAPEAKDKDDVVRDEDDCAGSDFDSDEVLSGDDYVMYGR